MRLQDVKRQIKKIGRVCLDSFIYLGIFVCAVYMLFATIVAVPFLVMLLILAAILIGIVKIGGKWINGINRVFSSRYGNFRVSVDSTEGKPFVRVKYIPNEIEQKERTAIEHWYQQFETGGPLVLMKRTTRYIWDYELKEWKKLSSVEGKADEDEETNGECQHQYTH